MKLSNFFFIKEMMMKLLQKTLLCAALAVSAPAWADFDFDVIGQVTAVTPQGITLNSMGKTMEIMVSPITEIEVEKRGFFEYDYHISLGQIQVGDWAKVEVIPTGQNQFMAKDIEIVRN